MHFVIHAGRSPAGVWIMLKNFSVSVGLVVISFYLTITLAFGASFEDIIDQEIANPDSPISQEVIQSTQKKHFVFVDGIMNELAKIPGNYYTDYLRILKKAKISYSHLRYPSHVSIPRNGIHLAEDLAQIHEKFKKPIILIGHSMGGAESLYAIFDHPSLLTKGVVEKVVIFEGAIGGSPLADHPKNSFYKTLLYGLLGEGLTSIRPDVARKNFYEAYCNFQRRLWDSMPGSTPQDLASRIRTLSDQVYYVQSYHPKEPGRKLSRGLRFVMQFFDRKALDQEPNDGLLQLKDQVFEGFGQSLAVLKKDHIENVVSGLFANSSAEYRRALARALIKVLHDPTELTTENLFNREKRDCLL